MRQKSVTAMTSGSIFRQLISFSLPLMLGNLFQLSYNMVDTVVIGRFVGSTALAAVGTCDQIMNLLILGVSGVCIGASVLMGNFFGAGDRDRLLSEMKTTVVMGLLFALGIMALGLPLAGSFFRWMQLREEARPEAEIYLRLIFLGIPFTCLYNIYAAALRSVGDSRTPVRFLILSCLMNMGLDLLLVAGLSLGVVGAALATVLSQGVSALLCIRHVSRNVPLLHISWRGLRMDPELAKQTLSLGSLTALQQCAQPIGNLIIQGSVNMLGISAAAAFSAARKIEDIGLLPGRSISNAITAFTAQNEGARNHARTEEGFRKGIILECVSGLTVSLVVLLLRQPLMSIFTTDQQIISNGVRYFSFIGFCYLLPCLSNGLQGFFRGMKMMLPSLLGSLTQISIRVLCTLLLVPRLGIPGVGIACVAGWSAMILWMIPYRRIRKRRNDITL